MKKVAIYARVSTEKQAEEQTIESQLSELREVCNHQQPVREYADKGWSGETLNRPELDRLRAAVRKGEINRLYVHSLDRLSRNLYQQGILVEELRKHEVEIYVKEKPLDFTGEGKLLFDLLGAVAEYEKWKILERTHRGRLYKARTKGIVGTSPPFGYSYVKKTSEREGYYEIIPEEANVVRLVYDLYLQHNSLNRVRRELADRSIKPPKKERWSRSTVHRMLTNESYIGTGYYGMRYSVEINDGKRYSRVLKRGRRVRDRSEWIPINFPAIVDKEKFRLAQQILAKGYRPYGHTRHFYLLSGLVRCAICDCTFTGDTIRGEYFYYRCNNRHQRFPLPRTCKAPMVRREALDESVWKAVSGAVSSPEVLKGHIIGLTSNLTLNRDKLEEKRKVLEGRLELLASKRDRLVDLYSEGGIDKETYQLKTRTLGHEEERIRGEIVELEGMPSQVIDKGRVERQVEDFCVLAARRLKELSPNSKREFLRQIVEVVVLDSTRRRARIVGHIPGFNSGEREEVGVSSSCTASSGANIKNYGILSRPFRGYGHCPTFKFNIDVTIGIRE